MAMIDSSEPTPEMMVEHLDSQVQTLLRENELLRAGIEEYACTGTDKPCGCCLRVEGRISLNLLGCLRALLGHLLDECLNQRRLLGVSGSVSGLDLRQLLSERRLRGGVDAFLLQLRCGDSGIVTLDHIFKEGDAADDASGD